MMEYVIKVIDPETKDLAWYKVNTLYSKKSKECS